MEAATLPSPSFLLIVLLSSAFRLRSPLLPPAPLSFYSTTYWKASFGRLRKLSSGWYRGSSRVPTFAWKFLVGSFRMRKLYLTVPQFSRSKGFILNSKQFFRQLTKTHNKKEKKKFWRDFSHIFQFCHFSAPASHKNRTCGCAIEKLPPLIVPKWK